MSPRSTRRTAAALAIALLGAGAGATSAGADAGNLSLTVAPRAADTLRSGGVELSAVAPAAVQGRKILLRVGTMSVASTAILKLKGSLRFTRHGRGITAVALEATLTPSGTRVTANWARAACRC